MSLLQQTPFVEQPLKQAISLYNDYVVPRLTKKNKVIAISTAVAMSLVYVIRDRIFKPSRKLHHILYIGYFSMFRSLLSGESYWDRSYRVKLPKLNAAETKDFIWYDHIEPGRLGWEVSVSNPEDAKRVLLKHEIFPKSEFFQGIEGTLLSRFVGGPHIVLVNGQHWESQRKVANPAFRRSMPVKLFGKLTQKMFQSMETMGDTVNFSDLMERWTPEAIGKAGFGFDFNAISDRDNKWVNTYDVINEGIRDPLFFLFPRLEQELLWMFPKRKQLHKELDTFLGMLDDVIQSKRKLVQKGDVQNDALEENEKDLLTLMIESEQRGEGIMSDDELKSNLCAFFLVGHDTTASALSFTIHYLAKYPEIQEKAREEAIAILGSEPHDVLPTVEEIKQMIYINQIMKETLRINGPAPNLVSRITAEDTELSGTFIPKGTYVNISIFNIHHSDKICKNGDEFNPDRFADDGEGARNAGEGMTWLPFGNGSRQCIGMNFSLSEQRVMLSMLLRKFTWSTPENSKHKDGLVTCGQLVVSPHDLDITFHKRY